MTERMLCACQHGPTTWGAEGRASGPAQRRERGSGAGGGLVEGWAGLVAGWAGPGGVGGEDCLEAGGMVSVSLVPKSRG